MGCGVEAGVYLDDLEISFSIRLPNPISMFQVEVLGIKRVCGALLNNYRRIQKATIHGKPGSTAGFVDATY